MKGLLSLLHSLGSLVWFQEPKLQKLVMLNPRKARTILGDGIWGGREGGDGDREGSRGSR